MLAVSIIIAIITVAFLRRFSKNLSNFLKQHSKNSDDNFLLDFRHTITIFNFIYHYFDIPLHICNFLVKRKEKNEFEFDMLVTPCECGELLTTRHSSVLVLLSHPDSNPPPPPPRSFPTLICFFFVF
jgi:hypothetical protein